MKTVKSILCTICAIVSLAAVMTSCSKEIDATKKEGQIYFSVVGRAAEFSQEDGVKSELFCGLRIKWNAGDKVYAYDGSKYLGELTVSLLGDRDYYAQLSGTLDMPKEGVCNITLIHSNIITEAPVDLLPNMVAIDLSSQTVSENAADAPFVAYSSFKFDEKKIKDDKYILDEFYEADFSIASSVMRLNCSGLEPSATITSARLSGMCSTCFVGIKDDGTPEVFTAGSGENINLNFEDGFKASQNGAIVIYAATGYNETAQEQAFSVKQENGKIYGWSFGSKKRRFSTTYNSICQMKEVEPYVIINGLKWARQNLAISQSGNMKWGCDIVAVKVPGTFGGEDVTNGDYFQWATYAGYCGNATDSDKGLLDYESFKSSFCIDGGIPQHIYAIDFKEKEIPHDLSPYHDGNTFTKYNETDTKTALEPTDDAANIILGGNWRMPTKDEFQSMIDATYWQWDTHDCGYYVYTPNPSSDAGKHDQEGTGTYNKSDALLFFPATSSNASIIVPGTPEITYLGLYWTSTVSSSNNYIGAYGAEFVRKDEYFLGRSVDYIERAGKYSIRPVMDVTTPQPTEAQEVNEN